MAKRKNKLPLREGTKLSPLTEEERLARRARGHPLDAFPIQPRMSQWREVDPGESAATAVPEKVIERSVERSIERSAKRSIERSLSSVDDRQIKEAYVALDATHTASEAKIYGYLYRLSIAKGQSTCRASLADFQNRLGLAKNTIIRALRGLAEKLSIDVIERRPGSRIGSLYRVYNVKEILSRRKEAGIEIDELKRIVRKGSIKRSVERSIERSKIERSMVQKLNVQLNVQDEHKSQNNSDLELKVQTPKNLYLRNDDDVDTSSSYSDDDDDAQTRIRQIYCHLTGNPWRSSDSNAAQEIIHIPIAHIILGICYSLDRATSHRVGSLKYCVPSILDHYEAMKAFPQKELTEIAYTHMLRVKQAQKTGNWEPGKRSHKPRVESKDQ